MRELLEWRRWPRPHVRRLWECYRGAMARLLTDMGQRRLVPHSIYAGPAVMRLLSTVDDSAGGLGVQPYTLWGFPIHVDPAMDIVRTARRSVETSALLVPDAATPGALCTLGIEDCPEALTYRFTISGSDGVNEAIVCRYLDVAHHAESLGPAVEHVALTEALEPPRVARTFPSVSPLMAAWRS